MTEKEVCEVINEISDYLYKTAYEEVSFTTMLKVDGFLLNLKERIRLEGMERDRIKKGNGIKKEKQIS
jgi:hypothetical protein